MAKILTFPQPKNIALQPRGETARAEVTLTKDERLERIQASLRKINSLMRELKETTK